MWDIHFDRLTGARTALAPVGTGTTLQPAPTTWQPHTRHQPWVENGVDHTQGLNSTLSTAGESNVELTTHPNTSSNPDLTAPPSVPGGIGRSKPGQRGALPLVECGT